jgi:hypothetical protein
MKPEILNPNTSGQGLSPLWESHPLTKTVLSMGYTYSHSTPVGWMLRGEQKWALHHTFKQKEHNVSLTRPDNADSYAWSTSTSCASGRKWQGIGAASLLLHLKRKAKRYGLTAALCSAE